MSDPHNQKGKEYQKDFTLPKRDSLDTLPTPPNTLEDLEEYSSRLELIIEESSHNLDFLKQLKHDIDVKIGGIKADQHLD